jgi:O-antigen ligase
MRMPWREGVAVAAVLLLIVGVTAMEIGVFLPVVLLAFAYVFWSYPRPLVAVPTIVLMNAYVIEQSVGISPLEVAVGLYMYGYLGYWFFRAIFIDRIRILTHRSDWYLTGFLTVCAVSVGLLLAVESRIDYWFREMLTLSTFLLCFPMRSAMRTDRGVAAVFGSFAVMVGTLAVINIVRYRASTLAANYLWELWGGRQAFGTSLYTFLAIAAVSLHAHVEGMHRRLATLLVAAIGAIALGTTFYRGFWIGTLLAGGVLVLLVDRRKKVRLLVTAAAGTVVGAGLMFLVAGDLTISILQALVVRLASSGNALGDVSIANRIAESQTVLRLVSESPLVGHGLGVWFHHLNIITRTTEVVMYVHNVYLYLLLEVGILGFVLFGMYYYSVIRQGIQISRVMGASPLRMAMIRGSVAILLGFLFIATNSGILQDKHAILVMVLGTAIVTSSRET